MEAYENSFIDEKYDLDDESENEEVSYSLSNFNLVTTPNDFNVATIVAFMDKGVFKIPSFQRNFVWDIQKASKLIESLIIGLPIPQIFLYEKSRNNFEVIDGQQRLLSLYFFVKGRFPKNEAKYQLRNSENSTDHLLFKEDFLNNDDCFTKFNLKLKTKATPESLVSPLDGKNYQTLDIQNRVGLDLATIRNMVIKSAETSDEEHLARYEIFNRLNSGGINLNGQEIRMSLYSCKFLNLLTDLNKNVIWRKFFGKQNPDNRLKDIELILRFFAMLIVGGKEVHDSYPNTSKILYQNSILSFLNNFANFSKEFDDAQLESFSVIWKSFMDSIDGIDISAFSNSKEEATKIKKISIPVFEAIFYGLYRDKVREKTIGKLSITEDLIKELKLEQGFLDACNDKTTSKSNVNNRLNISHKFFVEKGI
ncbi:MULTISPECIES: GmrSD restriction endonuclease domain-containing protein [Acinetobacter]|uniref:GmrSD restriction endonuclease domain-containing protein n=1 Tax=Acinetobacter TaxID=469 RepID=UPI00202EF2F5|nr:MULTISPECIES: DUF262 domain-containing protein [Acinetobacter]MCM1960052.1 DUF262 domain-containing protein [Acinetobacter modestus]WAU72759.1 DUF262 domain-containing protein [Acinetobacter sp. TR11]